MYILDKELWFPPVEMANPDGILAIGGDLSGERLLLAYRNGIFPWNNPGEMLLWWAPPKRMVVVPETYSPPKSMRQFLKKSPFEITFNQAFEAVITNCRYAPRIDQDGTWIGDKIVESFTELHHLGYTKSVEVWLEGELVGGLYGFDLGHVFCGESMFSFVSNASKSAFVALVNHLRENNYALLDCQVYNDHLALLGAFEIDRSAFMQILKNGN